MNRRTDWLMLATLILVALVVTSYMVAGQVNCEERGGHYVRGLFWFECVGGRP